MATPRTVGLMPRHRVRPALPNVSFSWSRLPTWPTVAMQSMENLRTSPLGIFTSARSPSLLINSAAPPNPDFAVMVAAAVALFGLGQGLFRLLLGDVVFVQAGDKPPRRCVWIKAFQSHRCLLPSYFFPAPPDNPSSGEERRTLNLANAYEFSAYSIIFSPSASFT